ncbi:MAG: aminotransferase class IV [Opitutales bacterium]
MYLYLNGNLLREQEAVISASDHGFLYGAGFFETFRTYGGRPHLLEEHVRRLERACRQLDIRLGPNLLIGGPRLREEQRRPAFPCFLEAIACLLEKNSLSDAVFRYSISGGPQPGGLPAAPYRSPTELLTIRPLPSSPPPEGVTLHLLETARTGAEFAPRPKSTSCLNVLAAHQELRRRNTSPGDEGLMLTPEGTLAEGVTTNLFFLRNRKLKTPSTVTGILPGVTRQSIIDLARSSRIPMEESIFPLRELEQADAIFLTNSVRELIPVSQVLAKDNCILWEGATPSHPCFLHLQSAYRSTVSPLGTTGGSKSP